MTDDEIIVLAHTYIEFDQGKIDGATLHAELAKCRDTGELIAVGTAYKRLKGNGAGHQFGHPQRQPPV